MSDPCCMRLPQLCQKQLWRVNSFSSSSGSSTQGWGFSHSKGVSLSECLNSVSAPSILIEPPCINTSHIQCVSQCTEGFQWTDCQIVWNWMEFSEVRGKEKEVRRTEHFSAAEGMGSSQGSVCSVTQAYTWGGVRDHLPQEFSFCERTFKRETLKTWESVCLKIRNKVDSFSPFSPLMATWQEETWWGRLRGRPWSCRSRRRGRTARWRRRGLAEVAASSCTGFQLLQI